MKASQVRRIYIRFVVFVIASFMLQGCGDAPEVESREESRPVKLMTIGGGNGGGTLEYPGAVSATQSVELGFEVPGKIIELPIKEGQQVTEGEVLARLDPADYEAARDAAKSNRQALSAAYNRAKNIFDQGAGSQAEVDRSLRDIQVAKEELKKAQKALDDASLKAPFSGEIAKKHANNFQNVQAKQSVLLLQDISSLEIDVTVPEQDFILGKPGLTREERTARVRPEIVISTMPDKRFPARFESVSTSADPVTRTYEVTLAFANPPDINILPGMTAKVVLHLAVEKIVEAGMGGLMVPSTAVAGDEQGQAYVWRVDAETMLVSRVPVELGVMSGANVRVLSGLEHGDRIAVSGVHHLREGMLVRPLGE
ncbi:MAG: efflux RND transporter periplasmic adaptor subunit [Pseudomonadales bacterium]|nr:efflux RND transporter periplasmic adaptor subunit [Pseudomonadales bacterium]